MARWEARLRSRRAVARRDEGGLPIVPRPTKRGYPGVIARSLPALHRLYFFEYRRFKKIAPPRLAIDKPFLLGCVPRCFRRKTKELRCSLACIQRVPCNSVFALHLQSFPPFLCSSISLVTHLAKFQLP